MKEIKTRGIVLNEMPIGESDKRITIYTKDFGKITAFARGARKQKSKFLSATQTFAYSDILLKETRTYTVVEQMELIEFFHDIRKDIHKLAYSMYLMELLEYVTVEQEPGEDILLLILRTLKYIEKEIIPLKLAVRIFELKLLCLSGYTPEVSRCSICGKESSYYYFNVEAGGIICIECNHNKKQQILQQGTINALEHIINSDLKESFKFNVSDKVLSQLNSITTNFIDYNFQKKFKTKEFIDDIEKDM